ncbi:MAG: hypothetical protein V3V16_07955 [Melioribacteraceae bacterium]
MLEISYILVFISLVIGIYVTIRKALLQSGSAKVNQFTILYVSGMICWIVYLYLISYNGYIYDKSMPPRFPIFVFIPAIIFMLYFFYTRKNSKLFEYIPNSWAIYYQSFRIIMEVIILMTFQSELIPIQATFQGYNFEILFALTAPIIGYFTFVKPIFSKRIAIIWNIIGILFLFVVVGIMVSSYFLPEMWGSENELIDIRFTQFPLILLPAFMVPSAIFVHIFSIMQIRKGANKV